MRKILFRAVILNPLGNHSPIFLEVKRPLEINRLTNYRKKNIITIFLNGLKGRKFSLKGIPNLCFNTALFLYLTTTKSMVPQIYDSVFFFLTNCIFLIFSFCASLPINTSCNFVFATTITVLSQIIQHNNH